MQQHPIPQNVITFEDRLFGEFTIRQFVILAFGAVLCFALYMSPLPLVLKYFLMIFFGVTSASLALVKISGIYLDVWLKNLVLALFGPTQFIWQKDLLLPIALIETSIPLTKKGSQHGADRIMPDFTAFFPSDNEVLDQDDLMFIANLNFDQAITPRIIATMSPEAVVPKKEEPAISWETKVPLTIKQEELKKTAPIIKFASVSGQMASESLQPAPQATMPPSPLSEKPRKHEPELISPKPAEIKPIKIEDERKQAAKKSAERFNLPVRQQVEVEQKNVITPIASEINFTLKPIFTLNLAGKEARYVSGLTNLRINRSLKNIYFAQNHPAPILGETKIMPSAEIEQRFEQKDQKLEELETQKEMGIINEFKAEDASKEAAPVQLASEEKTTTASDWGIAMPPKNIEPVPLNDKPPVVVQVVTEKDKTAPSVAVAPQPLSPEQKQVEVKPEIISQTTTEHKSQKESLPLKELLNRSFGKKKGTNAGSAFLTKENGGMKVTIPNLIYGSIKDEAGNLVVECVVIVKDQKGMPARALKSNHLGQFLTATPLPNGKYQIEFEKEGLKFDIINLELKGEIINSIEVTAKG